MSLDQHFWNKSFYILKQIALKHWIVNDKRWNKKAISRMSSVQAEIRRPSVLKKSTPFELMGPNVSKAIGMKVCVWANDWYFNSFRSAAPSAAAPAVNDVALLLLLLLSLLLWKWTQLPFVKGYSHFVQYEDSFRLLNLNAFG